MLSYWSNILGMAGVAIFATAFFREDWQTGVAASVYMVFMGAWFYGLSIPSKGGKK